MLLKQGQDKSPSISKAATFARVNPLLWHPDKMQIARDRRARLTTTLLFLERRLPHTHIYHKTSTGCPKKKCTQAF